MSGTIAPQTSAGALNTESTAGIVGYRLRRAQLHVFQRFLSAFDALGLRPAEFSMLVLIADNPGSKQNEIADALGSSTPISLGWCRALRRAVWSKGAPWKRTSAPKRST